MKLVLLLYLEEDDAIVVRLLEEHGVSTWSRVALEGHGAGVAGWYGSVAPYRSRMVFTVVTTEGAAALVDAVATLEGLADPRHPVHALQLDVERSVATLRSASDGRP
jgi:hypothetical protein